MFCLLICVPRPRWAPLHSLHIVVPKLMETHSGISRAQSAQTSLPGTERTAVTCGSSCTASSSPPPLGGWVCSTVTHRVREELLRCCAAFEKREGCTHDHELSARNNDVEPRLLLLLRSSLVDSRHRRHSRFHCLRVHREQLNSGALIIRRLRVAQEHVDRPNGCFLPALGVLVEFPVARNTSNTSGASLKIKLGWGFRVHLHQNAPAAVAVTPEVALVLRGAEGFAENGCSRAESA